MIMNRYRNNMEDNYNIYDDDICDDYDDDDDDDGTGAGAKFMNPGGNSALRCASTTNPRNLPCPTCGEANRLTPLDKAYGYQCDSCADRAERGYD
jgi:hypothetical protein